LILILVNRMQHWSAEPTFTRWFNFSAP